MTPTLPVEGTYSQEELNWIDWEPSGRFPADQASFWGQMRKVFADYIQVQGYDRIDDWYKALDSRQVGDDEIHNWEIMLGIPVDPSKSIRERRTLIAARSRRGAFTRSWRRDVVESFILATFGDPIIFTPGGVPFTSDGIPFYAGTFDIAGTYNIVEDIPGYAYTVRILDSITVSTGMLRELQRITPSPIDDNITIEAVHDPFMEVGGTLTLTGGVITDTIRTTGTEGDAVGTPGGLGFFAATTNLLASGGADVSGESGTTGFTTGSGNTLSSSTSEHNFGTHSLKVVLGGNPVLLSAEVTLPE
jgi:hypothetical protein